MRPVVFAAACSVFCLASASAFADSRLQGGGLGGGLLEFIVTGSSGATSRPAPAPSLAAPAPTAVTGADPNVIYANVPASTQTASLSPQEPMAVSREIPPEYRRQEVAYDGRERPGTIVIDTPNRFLYFVEPGGKALRYGIGVGRPGFEWSGVKAISRKAEWPDWTPPPQMLLRRPDLPRHMAGGPDNPLGARAMYLGSSMYRIHGTNEPWTIGQNVSSGCIRMMNEDVEDLYERARVGTKVIVM